MARITSLLLGAGLVALQGCSAAPGDEPVSSNEANVTGGTATLAITSDWGTGYCAQVTLTNSLVPAQATTRWTVILDLGSAAMTVTSSWNATFSAFTGMSSVTPVSYNTSIPAGGNTNFGWCANVTSTVRPTIKAWNMEANSFPTCETNSGLFPALASLAVAMATELHRWQPLVDLTTSNGRTVLSAAGLARCSNGCANTKAILAQQEYTPDQNVFNATNYMSQLGSAFGRQQSNISNFLQNSQSSLPPGHYLKLVGGPTNLGIGACGPHYVFAVTYDTPPNYPSSVDPNNKYNPPKVSYTATTQPKANQTVALSAADATNMVQTLCYFNQGNCGGNTYINMVTTACPAGQPSGTMCIAIDPTDGDQSSTSTTTAGSAQSYPGNRVYDPANDLLGAACITTKNKFGTLQSQCANLADTCGYLYCTRDY